jgi:hypothetical protein
MALERVRGERKRPKCVGKGVTGFFGFLDLVFRPGLPTSLPAESHPAVVINYRAASTPRLPLYPHPQHLGEARARMHAASGAMAAAVSVAGGLLTKTKSRNVFGGTTKNIISCARHRRSVTVRGHHATAATAAAAAVTLSSSVARGGGGGGDCVVTDHRSSSVGGYTEKMTTTTRARGGAGRRGIRLRVSAASSPQGGGDVGGGDAATVAGSAGGWRQYASVACVMLAVFLHLLGFTVTGPITPGLVSHFGLHPSEVGYLTSAYPLGMFFALFAWPRLSDKVAGLLYWIASPVR